MNENRSSEPARKQFPNGLQSPGPVFIFHLEGGEGVIEVSRLNKKTFILNCDWIETVEATPDTVITLTNGKKYVVAEKVEDIIAKVVEYKQKVFTRVILPNTGM